MVNPIDYDWRDEKLHKGRLLLGDPIAASVQVVMDYANNINFLNRGRTSYTIEALFRVFTQRLGVPDQDKTFLGYIDNNKTVYYPNKEQFEAICTLTGCQVSTMFARYFTELDRCTGRSLRIAVNVVQRLLEHPDRWIPIDDHEFGDSQTLLRTVDRLLNSVGIQGQVHETKDHYSGMSRIEVRIPPIPGKAKVLR